MQQPEIGRRLDRHDVARAGDGPKRQHQRFGAAAGDDDIVRRQRLSPLRRAARDLLAQARLTLGMGVDVVLGTLEARRAREKAVEPPGREQLGARDRAAERHQPRIGRIFQEIEHQARDRDGGGAARRFRDRGPLQPAGRPARDVEAGLRPRLDHPAILEQPIGLQHGGEADLLLRADPPHRRHARARRQRAAVDQAGDEAGQFLVAIALFRAHRLSHSPAVAAAI